MAPSRNETLAPDSRTVDQNSPALKRRRTIALAPTWKHA